MCIYSDISLLNEEAFFGCLLNEEAFECKGSPSSSGAFSLGGAFFALGFGGGFGFGAAAIIDWIAVVSPSMLVCIM